MFFSCQNAKKRNFVLEIDGKRIACENNLLGISANIELKKGNHLLYMRKRTWFDTPLYYLNVINPLYIIWHLKFCFVEKLGYDENFSAIEIAFQSNGEKAERIQLVARKNVSIHPDGEYYTLCCEQYSGIKKVVISELAMDKTRILRYKLTRILSMLFYLMFSSILFFFSYAKGLSSGLETLIIFLLNFWIPSESIIRVIFEKSVGENLKKYSNLR